MSQCSKDRGRRAVSKYLFILVTGIFLLLISAQGFSQDSSHRRPPPPPPPPHPKLKEMVDKIKKLNPFKKKNKDGSNAEEQANVKDDPKKSDPPPPPPPPDPVKPKSNTGTSNTTTKTTSTKKKAKPAKPATNTKKVTTPVI